MVEDSRNSLRISIAWNRKVDVLFFYEDIKTFVQTGDT